jgi:predicted transcriptional regulator with HTH domain
MTRDTWRDKAAPIIAKVIAENKDKGDQVLRKALFMAYPWGERRMHPYKIWLSEISRQLKKPKKTKSDPLQMELPQ